MQRSMVNILERNKEVPEARARIKGCNMLRANVRRTVIASVLSLTSLMAISPPAGAATIFLPSQTTIENRSRQNGDPYKVDPVPVGPVNWASVIPVVDEGPAAWGLLLGSFALMAIRRRKRLPSVTY
jgi:hypothetical protein